MKWCCLIIVLLMIGFVSCEEVIRLGSGDVVMESGENKTEDIKSFGEVIYESRDEILMKYSVFGFALLCVVLVVIVGWLRL